MGMFGTGGTIVIGIILIVLGFLLQSNFLKFLLDIVGWLIVIVGIIVTVVGVIGMITGKKRGAGGF